VESVDFLKFSVLNCKRNFAKQYLNIVLSKLREQKHGVKDLKNYMSDDITILCKVCNSTTAADSKWACI